MLMFLTSHDQNLNIFAKINGTNNGRVTGTQSRSVCCFCNVSIHFRMLTALSELGQADTSHRWATLTK